MKTDRGAFRNDLKESEPGLGVGLGFAIFIMRMAQAKVGMTTRRIHFILLFRVIDCSSIILGSVNFDRVWPIGRAFRINPTRRTSSTNCDNKC